MSTTHWEKERSAWLKARAGHRLGVRRRAEQLAVVARRQDRFDSGIGDSAFGEVATRNIFYRSVHREEGAGNTAGWFIWTILWMAGAFVLFGPALLIGLAAYGLWWHRLAAWGPMKSAPFYKLAALVGLVGAAVVTAHFLLASSGVTRILVGSWQMWPLEGSSAGFFVYFWLQVVLGLVRAGWRVRMWGWPAVSRVTRTATSAVKEVELDTLDADEPSVASNGLPFIQPIELNADDGNDDLAGDEIELIEIDAYDDVDDTKEDNHA